MHESPEDAPPLDIPNGARSSAGTLVEGITAEIRRRIAARELAPGGKLPSIRGLAAATGLSKATVVEAYDRLVALGFLTSRRGSGFFVAGRPRPLTLVADTPRVEREIDPLWIMRQSLELDRDMLKPGCGWLPPGWLNEPGIRRALRALSRAPQAELAEYGHPLGYLPLRLQLQLRLAERGIAAGPRQILLTDSGSQAIDLVTRLLVQPGDAVLVDDPCYFNFQANLRAHRARIIGIPYTPTGPDLDAFAAAAAEHRPRLYLTNAALHNPTGASLAPASAHRLLKLAEAHDIAIIEDDIFGDFELHQAPRLAALDQLDRVVHLGSFSKTLSAAMRCGYVAARADWIEGLIDLKLATSFGNNELAAQLVHRLLTDGSYRKHVDAIRERLRRAMAETSRRLQQRGLVAWTEPEGGLFLWTRLPQGADSADLSRRALEAGIVLAPGNVFSVSRTAGAFLRFNVAQSGHQRLYDFLDTALG